jgi:hypothetical protein
MKLTSKNGWWFCEFTNHKGDKQTVSHPDIKTARQLAFINIKHRFLL